MIFDNTQPKYSVLDLGFDKSLTKALLGLQGEITPEMMNVFSGGTAPRTLIAGELITALEQQAGAVFSGKTAFDNTQSGYRLGVDTDGTAKFYIGDATNYFNWTGSALNITGAITATSGTIGGWTIGATTLSATGITLNSSGLISLTSDTNEIRFVSSGGKYISSIMDNTTLSLRFLPADELDDFVFEAGISNQRFLDIRLRSRDVSEMSSFTSTNVQSRITVNPSQIECFVRNGVTSPTAIKFVYNSEAMSLRFPNLSSTPTTCTVGDICVSGAKLYICTTTDNWTIVGTQT